MGGESASREKSRLRKGCVILICTPGRLLYHLKNTKSLKLDNLQTMIFDEADRMLDMGFEKEMNECLEIIREKAVGKFRQPDDKNVFWSDSLKINFVSATMNPNVEKLGHRLMENYVKVGFNETGTEEKKETAEDIIGSIPKQIQQFFMEVPVQYRLVYLIAFLYSNQSEKTIVFVSNCETVNFL